MLLLFHKVIIAFSPSQKLLPFGQRILQLKVGIGARCYGVAARAESIRPTAIQISQVAGTATYPSIA